MKTIHGPSVFSFDEVAGLDLPEPSPKRQRRGTENPFDGSPAPTVIQSRAIVADTDVHFARQLARCLKTAGYDVTLALDGLDILTQVSPYLLGEQTEPAPHLIVAGAVLPGVTGLSILAGVQEGAWRPSVILVTSAKERASHHEAAWLGAKAVLERPFSEDLLVETVAKVQPAWTRVD
ncbi:MAG: response regulator transcription factor [Deltaproteobacteria bacterium]|nr:response regulator transcription factor [Deltaproteobacteria bacterium]